MILYPGVKRNTHAPVAQLDRVTDYESVGQGFESLPAYQKSGYPIRDNRFFNTPAGTRKGGPSEARVKKCPVDTFLARGRVPATQDAFLKECRLCCRIILQHVRKCKRVPSGMYRNWVWESPCMFGRAPEGCGRSYSRF